VRVIFRRVAPLLLRLGALGVAQRRPQRRAPHALAAREAGPDDERQVAALRDRNASNSGGGTKGTEVTKGTSGSRPILPP